MLRFAVLRALAVAAVFAVVWLVPLRAYAAIVPACEDEGGSAATSAAVPPNPPVDCSAPLDQLDELDPEIAAMCDERGATAVAPGRIHPMTDARMIERLFQLCEGCRVARCRPRGKPWTDPAGNTHERPQRYAFDGLEAHRAAFVKAMNIDPADQAWPPIAEGAP